MLKPIENWENVEGIEFGDYENLELGGHEVIIKNAYEYTGQTGTTSLKVEVDIAGNDKQSGFYQKQFDNNPNGDKRWPNGACKYLSLKEEQAAYLKGFTSAIENSNTNYKWNWDEKSLIGKKICGVFGLEEYEKQDGTVGVTTKLIQFRSLDKLNEVKIPKVKLLNGALVDYEEYQEIKKSGVKTFASSNPNEVVLDENLLD